MNIKTFYLNSEKTVLMKAYLLSQVESLEWCRKRPAILILPGGGYEFCSEREAEPVAMRYLAEGYNAFVLYYTCNKRYPAAFHDAAYALYKIRMRADEVGIDPQKIVSFILERKLVGVRLQLQLHKYIWDPEKRGV